MKAAFYTGPRHLSTGPGEARPPGAGEAKLRVDRCGICGTDLHIYLGHMDKRVKRPLVMGHEMAGEVAEIGAGVEGFRPGDRVVVRPLQPCGDCPACRIGHSHICHNLKFLGIDSPGAFQSFWTVPAHTLHRLPDAVPFELGALIEPLAVACHDVRLGEIKKGDMAVVIGGGPIGLLVALVAREAGANVLVSEVNPFRLDFARQLGFESINPLEDDLGAWVSQMSDARGADVVFEVSGSAAGAEAMTQLPRTRGLIVVVAIFADPPPVDLFRFFWRELRLRGARVYEPEDFEQAIQLAASRRLPLARLISATYPLEELGTALDAMAGNPEFVKALIRLED